MVPVVQSQSYTHLGRAIPVRALIRRGESADREQGDARVCAEAVPVALGTRPAPNAHLVRVPAETAPIDDFFGSLL